MTERLHATAAGIERGAALLRGGSVVAFPTDTVYGVAVAADRPDRVEALFQLKRRPAELRIPILVAGIGQLPGSGAWTVDERAEALASAFWPGALTLVLPSADGADTQAFRAPDHPIALALIGAAGPLLATSANVSGQPDALDADEVLAAFFDQPDLLAAVLDGGRVPGGAPSTVLDVSVQPAVLLRPGPIAREQLAGVIEVGGSPRS